MLRKILVCALILVAASASEAASLKIGLVKFGSPSEQAKTAEMITETFSKTLAGSDTISVLPRSRADKAINSDSDIQKVSSFGKAEGCRYILLGSVRRDRDIVISVRAVDVQTAKVEFSMSVSSSAKDNASLRAESMKLGDRVREKLTGDFPKVMSTNLKNNSISINRGSASGVKKGDLYRVYRAYLETMDREGSNSGRQEIDLAIIEVKSVQKSSGTAALFKNGGDPQIIPMFGGCKVEAISKTEAKKMIRSKAFSPKTIEKNIREAEQQSQLATMLNPNFSLLMIEGYSDADFETVKKMAENGHPEAQAILCLFYIAHKNFPEALRLAQEAAANGGIFANNILGLMYMEGVGVQVDYSKALACFTKAAENGDSFAQVHIGSMYFYGKGVQQDYTQALGWFTKARGQGKDTAIALASEWIGSMYWQGLGTAKDLDTAYKFLLEAAQKNSLHAKLMLGSLCLERFGSAKDVSAKMNFLKLSVMHYKDAQAQAKREQNNAVLRILQEQIDMLDDILSNLR